MKFTIENTDENSSGRHGKITTDHGEADTPLFMPVATKATVKLMDNADLVALGTQAIIANAFILYLRPGLELIGSAGGLHKFMSWKKILFTDSGGFQMIRRDFLKGVNDHGIRFNSPFDGTEHELTPELNMDIQLSLGADILMVQDDCAPAGAEFEDVEKSMKRTIDWAENCKNHFEGSPEKKNTGLFAIVQGGIFPELRKICIDRLVDLGFDGYALGGLSIGESKHEMYNVIEFSAPLLPESKPRYLMGVGSPEDIIKSVSMGIDIFDSVYPTRNARHSTVYTSSGKINISRGPFKTDLKPVDDDCDCFTCTNHSRAYINHLLKHKELLGLRLTTLHNLHFIMDLIEKCRTALKDGEFAKFMSDFLAKYKN